MTGSLSPVGPSRLRREPPCGGQTRHRKEKVCYPGRMERRRPISDKATQKQLQVEAFWRGLDGKIVDLETALFLLLEQGGYHLLISGELTTTFTLKNGLPAETLHYTPSGRKYEIVVLFASQFSLNALPLE